MEARWERSAMNYQLAIDFNWNRLWDSIPNSLKRFILFGWYVVCDYRRNVRESDGFSKRSFPVLVQDHCSEKVSY